MCSLHIWRNQSSFQCMISMCCRSLWKQDILIIYQLSFFFFFTLKSCPWALLCSLPLFHILQQIYIIDKKILFSEFNLHICWKLHILVRGYFWWFFFCNSKNFTHLRIIMIISWKKTHFINNLLAFNFFLPNSTCYFFSSIANSIIV